MKTNITLYIIDMFTISISMWFKIREFKKVRKTKICQILFCHLIMTVSFITETYYSYVNCNYFSDSTLNILKKFLTTIKNINI